MLTRRAKAYNSSCSQIVFVYLQPSSQFNLEMCAAQTTFTGVGRPLFDALVRRFPWT